jgi:hypothetical protein
MAKDVAAYIAWASEPHAVERKQAGLGVLAFLALFAGVTYELPPHLEERRPLGCGFPRKRSARRSSLRRAFSWCTVLEGEGGAFGADPC